VRWRAGRQNTPVEVRGEDGNWQQGTLKHWNPGYNGLPPQGRIEVAGGGTMRGVAADALRAVESGQPEATGKDGKDSSARPIGEPVTGEITDLVRQWVVAGQPVKVFSRRITDDATGAERTAIEKQTEAQFGKRLPVTDKKQKGDGAVYDDSSNVEHNTGRILSHSTNPGDAGKPILVDFDGTLVKDTEENREHGSATLPAKDQPSGAPVEVRDQAAARQKLADKWRTLRRWSTT
jgi:hypothetical protein